MEKPLDPEFLKILACPLSRAPLLQEGDTLVSTDPKTRRQYRIEDGIPNLLIEEGKELAESDWKSIMEKHQQ